VAAAAGQGGVSKLPRPRKEKNREGSGMGSILGGGARRRSTFIGRGQRRLGRTALTGPDSPGRLFEPRLIRGRRSTSITPRLEGGQQDQGRSAKLSQPEFCCVVRTPAGERGHSASRTGEPFRLTRRTGRMLSGKNGHTDARTRNQMRFFFFIFFSFFFFTFFFL